MEYVVRTILANWNLSDARTERIHDTTWEIDEQYILKAGTNLQWMHNSSVIINALTKHGLPVARIIKNCHYHSWRRMLFLV